MITVQYKARYLPSRNIPLPHFLTSYHAHPIKLTNEKEGWIESRYGIEITSQKKVLRTSVTWAEGMEFIGEDSQGRNIPMEATKVHVGTGKNPVPMEVFPTSLGGCIAVEIRWLLIQRGLGFEALKVSIAGTQRDIAPKTIERVDALIEIKGGPDPAVVKEVVDLAMKEKCPIVVMFSAFSMLGWRVEQK